MNKPIIIASQNYLCQKYKNTTQLYKHILTNQIPPNLRPIEVLYHIVYLGTSQERRINGDQAKYVIANYLKQFKEYSMKLNNDHCIALLFSLSNFLLYDEQLMENIIQQLNEEKTELNSKSITRLLYCFYKLNLFDHSLYMKRRTQFWNMQLEQQGIQELIQVAQIESNINHIQERDSLINIIAKLRQSLINQPLINFTPEINYKFCQIIYNIYPEIIQQSIVKDSNPFKVYFDDLKKYFVLCKSLIDRTQQNQLQYNKLKSDYGSDIFLIASQQIEMKQTKFESQVNQILTGLKLNPQFHKRVLIYDVDFLLQDNIIVNCNGPLHFIQNLDQTILGISPNFLMQQRHIQLCGDYKIINLNFQEWDRISPYSAQVKHLQNILNSI